MPKIHVTPFFRFCRVKVVKQEVDATQNMEKNHKYYAKLEKEKSPEEQAICESIEENEGKWQQAIWWTFIGCFALFFWLLVVVLCS